MSIINKNPKIDSTNNFSIKHIKTDTIKTSSSTELIHYNKTKYKASNISLLACFLAIIIVSYVKFTYPKYVNNIFDAIFSYRETAKMFQEKNLRVIRGSIILFSLFLITTSLFLLQIYNFYKLDFLHCSEPIKYLTITIGLIIIYISKSILIRLCGYIFNTKQEAKEYIHTIFTYNKIYGIIIIPIICFMPYTALLVKQILIITGLSIALLIFILRLFRGIWILFKKQLSIFYMILYLCALEILPLLLLLKAITKEIRI